MCLSRQYNSYNSCPLGKTGTGLPPKNSKNSMDFQLKLKLTFNGKNHKDLDSNPPKSLDTLIIRLINTQKRVKHCCIWQEKRSISIKTRKLSQENSKNGGKLVKTSYFHLNYKRSPKPERALPQFLLLLLLRGQGQENKERLRVLQLKLEKTTYQRINCRTCPRAQRVLQLLLENYHN